MLKLKKEKKSLASNWAANKLVKARSESVAKRCFSHALFRHFVMTLLQASVNTELLKIDLRNILIPDVYCSCQLSKVGRRLQLANSVHTASQCYSQITPFHYK
jgi:hypothetical protein